MGQASSTDNSEQNLSNKGSDLRNKEKETKEQIHQYFDSLSVKQFTPLELFAFKKRICKGKDLNEIVSDEDIISLLYLPKDNGYLIRTVLNMIRTLSAFPFMKSMYDNITGIGLLKTIILLHPDRYHKYIGSKNYEHLKLLFISLSLNKEKNQIPTEGNMINSDTEYFSKVEILKSFDNIDINEINIPVNYLLQFITWILVLSNEVTQINSIIELEKIVNGWNDYKTTAMNIIRTMNPKVISNSSYDNETINYSQLINVIKSILPNFMNPLNNIFEHLLFIENDLVDHTTLDISFPETKLMTKPLFAQLRLCLSKKDFPVTKIQKLYVGRESGFSMRSLQGKTFKWLAPSIFLVSGMRIIDDDDYGKNKNPRYKHFLNDYRKLRNEDQNLDECLLKKRKVVFAVCIAEPWRVTNKDFFSGPNTIVVQLSPKMDIYKANRDNITYFNTIGGGLGIGNEQPQIKANAKTFKPGNISLTIDSSLEFGVFRNVGRGGSLNPGLLAMRNDNIEESYELRFLIQDVEVWGCGGKKELEEQLKQLKWEEAEAKRRQAINLKSLSEDRALLELAGLVGQAQSGGSV